MTEILGDPEALVAEVSRRAHHRAVEIEEEARRGAGAILEGAKEEEESIQRESAQAVERQVAAFVRRNAARAELVAKRRFLQLRELPITRVWSAAEKRLRDLVRQPDYLEALRSCALRAARELGASELTLAADPAGHGLLSEEILDEWSRQAGVRFRRAPEPAVTWGGLLATAGRSRFDATFPAQLALAKVVLRDQAFEILSRGKV